MSGAAARRRRRPVAAGASAPHDDPAMKPVGQRKRRTRLCTQCRQRRARYRSPDGSVRSDRQHDLCRRCYRSARDRLAATARMNDPEERLRLAIREECHRQIDDLLQLRDEETGLPLLEVLVGHMALGYGINVSIQVRHPWEDGRAEEDPSVTEALAQPAPVIEVVPG